MANKTKSPYKQRLQYRETYNTTLRRVYEYSTTKYSKRPATQFADGTQAYTYASFKDATERLSQRMSRYGISAGDKVAILAQKTHCCDNQRTRHCVFSSVRTNIISNSIHA